MRFGGHRGEECIRRSSSLEETQESEVSIAVSKHGT